MREAKIAGEPAARIGGFAAPSFDVTWIDLEAGPLPQWFFAAMKGAGLALAQLQTRPVRAARQTMPVKTGRNGAGGIAQVMWLGWFRPVPCQNPWRRQRRGPCRGAQARAVEALRHRDEPARNLARHRAEGRAGGTQALRAADRGEQLSTSLSEGEIAKFVKNGEVVAGETIGDSALPPCACFSLQAVDEINGLEEAAAQAGADAASRDGNHDARAPNQRQAASSHVAAVWESHQESCSRAAGINPDFGPVRSFLSF